jgi:hypothetical protein
LGRHRRISSLKLASVEIHREIQIDPHLRGQYVMFFAPNCGNRGDVRPATIREILQDGLSSGTLSLTGIAGAAK